MPRLSFVESRRAMEPIDVESIQIDGNTSSEFLDFMVKLRVAGDWPIYFNVRDAPTLAEEKVAK